jgi:hypothetical protein
VVRSAQLRHHQTPIGVAPRCLLLTAMLRRRWLRLMLKLFLNGSVLTVTDHVGALIVSFNISVASVWFVWVSEGVENHSSVIVIWVSMLLGLFRSDLLKVWR